MKVPQNILTHLKDIEKPAIIAISGFGGSGKSTIAKELGNLIKAPVIGIDSFYKDRDLADFTNWDVMDFDRFKKEVVVPMLDGENPISYNHFDWEKNEAVESIQVHHDGLIIVEGVGLFRPDLLNYLKYKIWVNCPLEEAIRRGKKRDREEYHNPQNEMWDGIWKDNDVMYWETDPADKADARIDNS